jgi:hypothetical protein
MAMPRKRRTGRLAEGSGMSSVKSEQNKLKKMREPLAEDLRRAADLKAAREILSTRIGGYSGIVLPGGKKIK